jgi:hypothetical protein
MSPQVLVSPSSRKEADVLVARNELLRKPDGLAKHAPQEVGPPLDGDAEKAVRPAPAG